MHSACRLSEPETLNLTRSRMNESANKRYSCLAIPLTRLVVAVLLLAALAGCSKGPGLTNSGRERAPERQNSRGGLANSPWPRVNHDNGKTALSELLGPNRPALKHKWSHLGSPVIGADGTFYVNSKAGLVALAPNGKKKWEYRSRSPRVFMWTPSVARDGTLYSYSPTDTLIALRPDGRKRWEYEMRSPVLHPPLIGADGTIYCADEQGRLIAFGPNGRERWVFEARHGAEWRRAIINQNQIVEVAAAPNGTLYLTANGPRLYAISPGGKELWSLGPSVFFGRRPEPGKITPGDAGLWPKGSSSSDLYLFPPMTGPDGTAYVLAATSEGQGSRLHAIGPRGRIKWSSDGEYGTVVGSALGPNGTVYVADDGGDLTAFDPSDGKKKWLIRFAPQAWSLAGPSVDASGTIYVGCDRGGTVPGALYAFNSSGRRKWRLKLDAEPRGQIVIGRNRTLYVYTRRWVGPGLRDFGGYLLAIGEK